MRSPATEPAIEMPIGQRELALISERDRSFPLLQRRFRQGDLNLDQGRALEWRCRTGLNPLMQSARTLEFDRIVEAVTELALTPLGSVALSELEPSSDLKVVVAAQAATSETVGFLE